MAKPDGGELHITLLRPIDWLELQERRVGNEIDLDWEELGATGRATILAIETCPSIETGSGRIVTGTFRHSAVNVIILYVSTEVQPIGSTANHPFWSETRKKFVPAGTLEIGERLRSASADNCFITSLVPREEKSEVFNLEIETEHTYSVGENGILVHNTYVNRFPDDIPIPVERFQLVQRNGKSKTTDGHGNYFTPRGNYNFVVLNGNIYVHTSPSLEIRMGRAVGHIDISLGGTVEFAAELRYYQDNANR